MKRMIALFAATAGSIIGWWIGARVGLMTAYLLSTVGTGAGLYYGARFAREWLP